LNHFIVFYECTTYKNNINYIFVTVAYIKNSKLKILNSYLQLTTPQKLNNIVNFYEKIFFKEP